MKICNGRIDKIKKFKLLLHEAGFLLYKNNGYIGTRAYWLGRNFPDCKARAITSSGLQDLQSSISFHSHAPDPNAEEVVKVIENVKRETEAYPEAPPAQILRTKFRDVPSGN